MTKTVKIMMCGSGAMEKYDSSANRSHRRIGEKPQRKDQVSWKSEHSLLTGHTRRDREKGKKNVDN